MKKKKATVQMERERKWRSTKTRSQNKSSLDNSGEYYIYIRNEFRRENKEVANGFDIFGWVNRWTGSGTTALEEFHVFPTTARRGDVGRQHSRHGGILVYED